MNFALILFILVVVSGIAWIADRYYFAPQRRIAGIDRMPLWLEYTAGFFPVICAVFVLRSFLVEPFKIPSGSMIPTLQIGDFILVNKFTYGIRLPVINQKVVELGSPKRGDVVVFRYPRDESVDYIKQSLPSAVVYAVRDGAQAIVGSVQALPKIFNPANAINSVRDSAADPATRPSTIVGASQVGGEAGKRDGLKGVLMMLAYVNVFVGVFNMFPSLPFDGGHAAVATYERLRSRKDVRYRADFGKMIPLATAVIALLILITFAGLYLDITQPFG